MGLSEALPLTPFILTHWRSGVSGTVCMGIEHGAYCVGCCFLMGLLFFGGMNVYWIIGLAAYGGDGPCADRARQAAGGTRNSRLNARLNAVSDS